MKTIETDATVTDEGKLLLNIETSEIPPGKYRVIMLVDEAKSDIKNRSDLNFPTIDVEWPENFSLRREDMYNEWGR
ncbi:MAG: hypothetical protein ABRQ38_29475 [Candidatus Eremiobacterota bacterium]